MSRFSISVEKKLSEIMKDRLQVWNMRVQISDMPTGRVLTHNHSLNIRSTTLLVALIRRVPATGENSFECSDRGQHRHTSLPDPQGLGVGRSTGVAGR